MAQPPGNTILCVCRTECYYNWVKALICSKINIKCLMLNAKVKKIIIIRQLQSHGIVWSIGSAVKQQRFDLILVTSERSSVSEPFPVFMLS